MMVLQMKQRLHSDCWDVMPVRDLNLRGLIREGIGILRIAFRSTLHDLTDVIVEELVQLLPESQCLAFSQGFNGHRSDWPTGGIFSSRGS